VPQAFCHKEFPMFYWRWFNRPRHPLLRLMLGVVGALLLVGILVLGFFALVAFAFIGGIVALIRAAARANAPAAPRPTMAEPHVIEGEFSVIRSDSAALKH
jgi:hypothetical protein